MSWWKSHFLGRLIRRLSSVQFISVPFTIAKTWKQPKCPLTDEWIKMWYIYTMGYYSATKKNETVRTNPDSILKSRDITLLNKVHLVKAMVFPVVMYGCENWTIKKAECQRIDAFELWCWRRLLRVHWTVRRFNQSILKEISLEYSLEDWCWSWNYNTLATWCKELTHLKRPWCWKRLRAAGEVDDRGWDGWMASLTQWTWVWVNSGSWWWTERPGMLQSTGSQRVGHNWATELNWTWSRREEHWY